MSRLAVHVTPKAGRDEIGGWSDGELELRVTAPAEGGKATLAACVLVAKALGVPKSSVRVARGETSRHKLLDLPEVSEGDLRAAVGAPRAG
jgi:uncharacterized protein